MDDRTGIHIADRNHPFWKLTTGSELKLFLNRSNQIDHMVIKVYSVSKPYVYQINVVMKDGTIGPTVLHVKKDTIQLIKNEWLKYYEKDTTVETTKIHRSTIVVNGKITLEPLPVEYEPSYIPNKRLSLHESISPRKKIDRLSLPVTPQSVSPVSPVSPRKNDSPRTDSPRTTNLLKRVSENLRKASPRFSPRFSRKSSPRNNSSKNNSPRNNLSESISPRTPKSPRSNNSSKESTPR